MTLQLLPRAAALIVAIVLSACGGDDAPAPTIGPAGGTVTGANGATIVVPAGALAQELPLQITEISAASANLPAGAQPVSAIYALTPHGTTFALPVAVTLPFDPALVPAGRGVQVLKTTDAALAVWAPVAGAAVSGSTISAEVSSFSLEFAALLPALPTITTQPADLTVAEGQSATFSVVAQANNLGTSSYQWQRDGANIAGETAASYTLANASLGSDNGAMFSVIVDNGFGTVTSGAATLTVTAAATGGWTTLGNAVFSGGRVRLGGLAVSRGGKLAVAYVAGGGTGATVFVGELRVSEWSGNAWAQLGAPLNLTASDQPSLSPQSIAYDRTGRPVVAWLDRPTLTFIVQRWDDINKVWERLGNPLAQVGAATGDPQLEIDPVTDQPIVVISSGPFVTVRTWTGTDWSPAGSDPGAISLSGGLLIVADNGQRLLAISEGEDRGGTLLLARLLAPDLTGSTAGQYRTQVGPTISATSFPAADFFLALATDGSSPFALIGDSRTAALTLRRFTGTDWVTLGAGPAVGRVDSTQMRVTPFGLPMLAYRKQVPFGALQRREVNGAWWDGTAWQSVPSPHLATQDAVGFALAMARSGQPYVAIATNSNPGGLSTFGDELVVRRFDPVTLTIVVNGAANSGSVAASGQTCAAGSTCDVLLPAGTVVVLDATAGAANLQSWTGCDTVVATRCTVTVGSSRSVTATFQ